MRLLHLNCAIALNMGNTMEIRLFFNDNFSFNAPDMTISVDFTDKLIVSKDGYGFSFLTERLVITDDETDIEMPPFAAPYFESRVYPESRAVFVDADTHEHWITGRGRKRPSEAAGFTMQDIQRMFR